MSTKFAPLEIPPGVVAKATKRMRSTNWSEVNAMRWVEGRLTPIGGQQIIGYTFASRCRAIHPWYDLAGNYYVAYLCEQNVYVDFEGMLYEITPTGGLPPATQASDGYGVGNYNYGDYGEPPRGGAGDIALQVELAVLPDVFSIDNFGAILLVMTSSDGRLLMWDPGQWSEASPTEILTQVPNSPNGRSFVVTSDRFVMIFGALTADNNGSARRFAWCDEGDITDWDFTSVTNQAGYLDLEPASPIITAISGRAGWVLFWTAKKAYLSTFLGLPFVYDYQELGDNCTPWSPASVATTSSMIMWISQQGVFSFDGTSIAPVPCLIRPWIDADIDLVQARFQAAAAHLSNFNEFWWFFPQKGQPFNTRAAIYNYKEGWWSQCQMPRSAGITSSYTANPIFADGTQPYQHESGNQYNDCPLPYADTFDMNLVSGGRLATLKQAIVDVDGDQTNLNYQIFYSLNRLSSTPENVTPPIAIRPDGYVDFRTTGRDMRLRLNVIGPAVNPFTIGQHLVDVAPRGDR
jgi:hypothetical protein